MQSPGPRWNRRCRNQVRDREPAALLDLRAGYQDHLPTALQPPISAHVLYCIEVEPDVVLVPQLTLLSLYDSIAQGDI